MSLLSKSDIVKLVEDVGKALKMLMNNKVDKVSGKGLSSNDYTTEEKNKLSGIANNATKVTESTVSGWGFTKNEGTVTGIKMNGSSKGTSGVVDLGTVLTSHQDIAGKLNTTGDASNTTASFTAASSRANIATGEKLSVLFGKIAKWFADLGSLAFKSNVTSDDFSGTLSIAKGGTGKTTANDAANYFINSLSTGSDVPVDNDYYVSQYVNGGTNSTSTFHRRSISKLWEYMKGKIQGAVLEFSEKLVLKKGFRVSIAAGNGQTNGYYYIAQININNARYIDHPIIMNIVQRGYKSGIVIIDFASADSADPNLVALYKSGTLTNVYIRKSAAGIWDLYIIKNGSWDVVEITNIIKGYENEKVIITWKSEYLVSLPDGCTTASEFTWQGYLNDASLSLRDYANTSKTIKVGYSGSSLTGDEITGIAGYKVDSDGTIKVKDVATGALKAWLGLGSWACKSSGSASDVGLGNVTNNKQVKGLSSGTTSGHVVTWGSDGYTVADSGFTIGKSVPSNAVFTDTNTWRPLGTGATDACAGNDARLSNARAAAGGTSDYANRAWTESHRGSYFLDANWNGSYFVLDSKSTGGDVKPIKVDTAASASAAAYADSAGSAGSSQSCSGNSATASVAAALARSAQTNNPMYFYWAGQGGQPSWLWGGSDGTNMYVYNPSNFSVAQAAKLGANAGNDNKPVYFSGGVPVICSFGTNASKTAAANLYRGAVGSAEGAVYITSNSSRRFKNSIEPVIDENLNPEKLYAVTVSQYKYNEDYLDESDSRYGQLVVGFIAEDIYEKYPVAAEFEEDEDGNILTTEDGNPIILDWNYKFILPPMLKLIQDQKKEINDIKVRLEQLEKQMMNMGGQKNE